MTPRVRGCLQIAGAGCVWGTWSLFVRNSGLPGLASSAVLMSVLAVGGIPSQWRGRRRQRSLRAWLWMATFGVLDAANSGFFFLAVSHGPVGVATLSHYLAPTLTPLMAFLFLREVPSRRTYPAVFIGLVGLVLLLHPTSAAIGSSAGLTAALGASSAVFYATMVPLGKKLAPDFAPLEVQGYHSYISALLLWLVAAPQFSFTWGGLGLLVVGCTFCGVLAGGLFYAGIRSVPSGLASVLTYCEPLVATAVGAIAFHEAIAPIGYLGVALVVGGGVYLAVERRAPQLRVSSAA